MADNNLEVKITADVADLQAKLALAQQNLREATTAMQGLAKEVSAGGGQRAEGRFREAAAAVAEYTGQVGALRGAMSAATSATEGLSLGTSGALRSLIVLGHEVVT